jgi:hypothetical protein
MVIINETGEGFTKDQANIQWLAGVLF